MTVISVITILITLSYFYLDSMIWAECQYQDTESMESITSSKSNAPEPGLLQMMYSSKTMYLMQLVLRWLEIWDSKNFRALFSPAPNLIQGAPCQSVIMVGSNRILLTANKHAEKKVFTIKPKLYVTPLQYIAFFRAYLITILK